MNDRPHMTGPLWMQVVEYAREHANGVGIAHLERGELRRALDPAGLLRPYDVSRAIATARRHGALLPRSDARALWLPANDVTRRPKPARRVQR